MSAIEFICWAVLAWIAIGAGLTVYLVHTMRAEELDTVYAAIIGESGMSQRRAGMILGVMGTLAWPITMVLLIGSLRQRRQPSGADAVGGTMDDDEGDDDR